MNEELNRVLRNLPSVEELLEEPAIASLLLRFPRASIVDSIRKTLHGIREDSFLSASVPDKMSIVKIVVRRVEKEKTNSGVPIINATGTILHTNYGRAPLPKCSLEKAAERCSGYLNIESDLEKGERGERMKRLREKIALACGAEDALVVNNNSAAVLLALIAISNHKEAVVSRGELVQIGGGFRVPEIIEQGGVILKEVGTTNQTYVEDYEKAVTEKTAMLFKVAPSNFEIVGFTHSVSIKELAALAQEKHIPLVFDLGSGAMFDTEQFGLRHEMTVSEALKEGCDLVCFSGDKLLGGCQAGIIVGRKELIGLLAKHPLMRIIRQDKITEAILTDIIDSYLDGKGEELPVWKLIRTDVATLQKRAERILAQCNAPQLSLMECSSVIGGGSMPNQTLPSIAISIQTEDADGLAKDFRLSYPPVVGRIEKGLLLFDLRTVFPEQDEILVQTITSVMKERK